MFILWALGHSTGHRVKGHRVKGHRVTVGPGAAQHDSSQQQLQQQSQQHTAGQMEQVQPQSSIDEAQQDMAAVIHHGHTLHSHITVTHHGLKGLFAGCISSRVIQRLQDPSVGVFMNGLSV